MRQEAVPSLLAMLSWMPVAMSTARPALAVGGSGIVWKITQ